MPSWSSSMTSYPRSCHSNTARLLEHGTKEKCMLANVHKVVLDINLLQFIIAVAIPVVVSLVTKSSASSQVKAVTQVALATLVVAIERIITANGVVDLQTFASTLLVTELTAIAAYYGLLKHTVTPVTSRSTDRFGLG